MSCCNGCIFAVPEPWHLIILIMNIAVSGSGTFISAYCQDKIKCRLVLVGMLQFILMPVLIGWFWSIVHGILVFKLSTKNMMQHPFHYDTLEEYDQANQVDLMEPVDLETFIKVTKEA